MRGLFFGAMAWHQACFTGGMNTGFYSAAIQMSTSSMVDMEVHTQNLSHSSMPGYKRLETDRQSFAKLMERQVAEGEAIDPIKVNYRQGTLRVTDRSLDFAIEGNGFFVVSDGKQEFYTRNGNFSVTPDGSVVNSLGMHVQTTSGELRIPAGGNASQLVIDDQRNIRIGKQVIGQIKVAAVRDPAALEQAGTTLFINRDGQEADADCTVMNGALEQSNTAVFEEMVGIMTTLRNYEACQKMMRTVDEADGKMMDKLV